MTICEDYFSGTGILFESEYEDAAVHFVRSDPDLSSFTKKEIIMCWFQTTYGEWQGLHFRTAAAAAAMSRWLKENNYRTYEEYFDEWNNANSEQRSPQH